MKATGSIQECLGLLAGRSSHRATLEELHEAAAAGMCWCEPSFRTSQPKAWLRRVYGFTAAHCSRAIEALISSRSVKAERPAVAAGLQLLASGVDFADGVIAFSGRQLGGELLATFDRTAARLLSEAGESVLLF